MKKLLSVVLALSLCLTAMMGCFTVSAAETNSNIITSQKTEVVSGNDAVVTFTLATEEISAAMVEFSFPNLEIKAISYNTETLVTTGEEAAIEFAHSAEVYSTSGDVSEDFTKANADHKIRAIFNVGDMAKNKVTKIDFVLTFKTPAVGDYTVSVSEVQAATAGTCADGAWSTPESLVTVDKTNASSAVEVKEATTEPTVDTSLALGRTILARDKMGIRFVTIKSQLDSYDSYYLEVVTQHFTTVGDARYTKTTSTDVFEIADAAAEDTNYLYFDYTGITAYEMTLPIKATIYCVNDDVVTVKSQTWEFTLANRILTSAMTNSESDAAFVDMVNYGAAVQTYFANQYPDSDLGKHGILPNVGFDAYQQYATSDEIATAAKAKSISSGVAEDGYNAAVGKGLQIQATNQIYFVVAPSAYDVNNMRLVVEYVNSYGADKSVTIALTDLVKVGSYYYYYAEGNKNVALYDTAVPVVAKLYLGEDVIYTRTYSVESFVAESMQSGNNKAVGDNLMKFTYSLRAKLRLS